MSSCASRRSLWTLAQSKRYTSNLILHKVSTQSFGKSQFPHKSINLFLLLVMMKDTLTIVLEN